MSDTVDKARAWDEITKKNAEIERQRARIERLEGALRMISEGGMFPREMQSIATNALRAPAMTMSPVDKIADAIAAIPARNPGYISVRQETLGNLLSPEAIRKIAQIAAAVAQPDNLKVSQEKEKS